MLYKIEKGIKILKKTPKYPFKDMDVGDSFFIEKQKDAQKCYSAAYSYTKYNREIKKKTVKFSTLPVKNGYRCWRVG